MKKTYTAAFLSLALLFSGSAQAETLLDIYDKAKRNDPAIREAEANMLAQMEAKPQALSRWLPQVDFSAGIDRNEADGQTVVGGIPSLPTDTTRDTTTWNFSISQSLLNTATWRQLKRANKEVARAQIDYQVAQQELITRVAEAYFNLLAAQDTLTSEQAAKDAIGRQLEQAERRFEVGLIAITDVKEAQAGYDDAVALEIAAKRSLATRKEALREITGEYPQTLANPGKEFPLIPPAPQVEQDWVDISLQQNLALESAKIGAEITRDNIKIAKGGHWPTLDLNASTGDRDTDLTNNIIGNESELESSSKQIGLQFRLPIYSGGSVSSQVQQEVYLHRAARENYEKVARATERETRDAYLGVIAEIARVQALARSEDSNKTALEATEAGYQVGTRTTVDVLTQRQSLFLSQTRYARSKYDYLINILKLKQAAGTLNEDDVRLINGWLVTSEALPTTPGRGSTPDVAMPATVIEDGKAVPLEEDGSQPVIAPTPAREEKPAD